MDMKDGVTHAWTAWTYVRVFCKSSIWISMKEILIPATAKGYSHFALSPLCFSNSLRKQTFTFFHMYKHIFIYIFM